MYGNGQTSWVHAVITTLLRIPVSARNKSEVTRLLRSLIEPTRVETGCTDCRLYQEQKNPNVLAWVEEWQTREDLDQHLRSPAFTKILAALDMADTQPEIRFDTVVETSGMQLIEEARRMRS